MEKTKSAGTDNHCSFPGKIGVITSAVINSEEEFDSVDLLISKYGADKVFHAVWSSGLLFGKQQMIDTVVSLAADKEIKALIINQATEGSNAAVDKLREIRDDIFIVYCTPHEPTDEVVKRADLIFNPDDLSMGKAMVEQARKQGAKVFVHYSFQRHMAQPLLASRRDMIRKTCAAEGLQFVEITALDPAGEAGVAGARQFILEDVPRVIAKYGEDTAFFATNCALQVPLIKAVVENHAIYTQQCCPSPYHGFPEGLGIEIGDGLPDVRYLIGEASRIAESKNMSDRLSTWPVSAPMMFTSAGAEYAIKWINGEVPKTKIDNDVLVSCMNDYIEEIVGEKTTVFIKACSEDGVTYNNYKLIFMSYLDL